MPAKFTSAQRNRTRRRIAGVFNARAEKYGNELVLFSMRPIMDGREAVRLDVIEAVRRDSRLSEAQNQALIGEVFDSLFEDGTLRVQGLVVCMKSAFAAEQQAESRRLRQRAQARGQRPSDLVARKKATPVKKGGRGRFRPEAKFKRLIQGLQPLPA